MATYTQGIPPIADPSLDSSKKFKSFVFGLMRLAGLVKEATIKVLVWNGSSWVAQ